MRRFNAVEYKAFLATRKFGVEFEVSNNVEKRYIRSLVSNHSRKKIRSTGYSQSVDNDYWHIKPDATCGVIGRFYDRGWEVASPVCAGYRDALHIANVANGLRKGGVVVNRNCGFHVHVDIHDFTPSQVGVLLAHWIQIEPYIIASLPSSRQLEYCTGLYKVLLDSYGCDWRWRSWSSYGFWDFFRPTFSTLIDIRDNPYRYRAVNIVNYALSLKKSWKRPTIEFRIAEGSVKKKDIINWIRLYVNFVETVKNKPMPCQRKVGLSHALSCLGLHHDENFYILSPGLQKTKTWLLERITRRFKYHPWGGNEAKKILNEMWNPVKNY